jgi:peptidoglycan/xylan/chitin deacetylase (PgdA/CDA1 family)
MIGVISKVDQVAVVEEFFELFKTPWEFYEPGRRYEVVVATVDDVPEVDARLLIVYGAETNSVDARNGITVRSRNRNGALSCQGVVLPIYGNLATFEENGRCSPCVRTVPGQVAGVRAASAAGTAILRFGYDLFDETRLLLSAGQPAEHAHVPTLDVHIDMLRNWVVSEGISLLEIPPIPVDKSFIVCLTHDIDFVGIRNHKFDHTMGGFLYRSTVGAVRNLLRGRISITRFLRTWRAVASLPLVYLGWAKDFWIPFEWYLRVENNLPATYFLIPFKGRSGEKVPGKHAARRASTYDVGDISDWTATLKSQGCELGVHGIDAWHSVEKGRAERERIAEITGESALGIRMHWLLRDANTTSVLESAGYDYDSTAGYNETIGYRSGTSQVVRPLGAKMLLELPLHIQDGALFYPDRLDLTEAEAERRCKELIDNAKKFGGVFTVLWHDRSHGPERFWGEFYIKLVQGLRSSDAWFITAAQAVDWFRGRRRVRFERPEGVDAVRVRHTPDGKKRMPPTLRLRIYGPSKNNNRAQSGARQAFGFADVPWNATTTLEFNSALSRYSELPLSGTENSSHEVCLHSDTEYV